MTATEWAVGIAMVGALLGFVISCAAFMWLGGPTLKPRKRHRPY